MSSTLISRTVLQQQKSQMKAVTNFFNFNSPLSQRISATSLLSSCALRQIHSQSFRGARFKLSLRRKAEQEDGEEKGVTVSDSLSENKLAWTEGGENHEGYLKVHPFRQLSKWKSKPELAKFLIDNQIYNADGLFVTNKPFGVGVRNPPKGKTTEAIQSTQLHVRGLKVSPYTLEDALGDLRYLLNKPKLTLVSSAEKFASGIALFADNEEIVPRFHKAVRSTKGYYGTFYNYHIVTVLPPLISNPLAIEKLGLGRKNNFGSDTDQPVVLREYSNNSVKRGDVKVINVKTRVLTAGYNTGSLVEVCTTSVKNNFLRIHCAEKLAPILGDHLYSSRVRMLRGLPMKVDSSHLIPGSSHQQLSEEMLGLLQLKRPEDSIIVPTHSHLYSYKIRKFFGSNSEIELKAPHPPYFKWTCHQLGITLPNESNH